MRTKAKKFSHKLLALLLAVVMALTCFTGVISAYGATQGRYDDDVEYNSLAWSVLSDEQVATALLDYADEMLPALKELEPTLAAAANSASLDPLEIEWDLNSRKVNLKIIGISLTSVTVKLGSVDELIETINSVDSLIKGSLIDVATTFGVDLGILPDLDLSALNGMSRSNTSSCDIVRGVLGLLYDNNDVIFGNILRGTFTLGVIPLDIYDLLGGMLGLTADEARADFAYNILQSVLFNYTDWFTPEEITNYKSGTTPFVFDDVLMEKMATELMDQINVLVTYPDGTSSATRLEAIEAKMEKESLSYEQAASALGYDPNIVYSTERGFEGNVLLFVYGDQRLQLSSADSLFSLGYKALGIAWNTVLKDTIKLIHVNYNVDRGHGSNFDNTYYYWYIENVGAWNDDDLATMYSSENVMAWANAVYADYEATSAEEFLGWVKDNLVHDRTVAEDAAGNWSDIDSTTLFNKLRYSPLADYYFDIQTGPINLYLRQTGTDNLDAFFETNYSGYSSLIAGLNDCLIAAVKDLFPESDNIYVETAGDTARPTMTTTGNFATIDDSAVRTITSTLVGNTLKMVQYVADTTDQNILNGFYLNNDKGTALAESNLEEAMIPLLIACIGNVNLGSGRLDEIIHPADWDACKDAEAVAFVCLREYLSYILPNKDYNVLVSKAADGSINATLEGTILPMARDAVTYVMEGYVPVTDSTGNAWSVKDREVSDENTLLELLNSVVCYYADKYSYEKVDGNAMGIAPLLGVCDQNGNSKVNSGNDIWTNFNNIANDLLPVLGTLQGKGEANFDSEDLIWNDVVLGVLDIDNTDVHASGFCGVSNFIYRLLTIFSSDLIQTNRIVDTAYELVKELFNGLFGPRYNGQIWYPVPDAASTHPFDDLLHKETLGGTGPDNVGAVQKLVNNFIEFSGFGGSGVATYPDTLLPGLVFVLTAVNSFVKILPDIADHSLSMASVDVANPTFTACSASSSNYSSITFTNNSKGVNIAYVDGMADTNVQLSRYYLKINSAVIEKPDGSTGGSSIAAPSAGLIAPGESVSLNTTTVFSPDAGSNSCTYAIVVNYDITDKDGTVLHENLESRTYQYLTSDVSWAETVYPESRIENGLNRFPESLESNSANETKTVNGFSVFTTQQFGDTGSNNRFIVNYPEYITLETGNLSAIDSYAVRVRNIKVGGLFGAAKTLYGFYFYDEATVRDDRTGSSVSVNSANAIPVFDKQTGDLLRIGLYDYSTDGGSSWTNGVDQSTLESAQNQFYQQNPDKTEDFVSRTHVAFTLDDAYNKGLIAAAHKNDRGLYDYVYMKDPGGDNGYHNVLLQISMRGPIDGFYLNTDSNPSIGNNASVYQRFLQYDGTTAVQGTTEPIESKICFWHNKASTTATLKFVVADTTVNDSVSDKIDEMTDVLNNYKDSDFDSPETITVAEEAISNALAVSATPITPESSMELNDTTQRSFVTSQAASATGDMAYKPLGAGDEGKIPSDILNAAYFNEADQLYYYDSEFVSAIYSNEALTSADVKDGKDAAGVPVTPGEDGKYYYTNTAAYTKEWDFVTYDSPWYKDTDVQATDENGNLLYNQIQFNHYNANGNSVRYVDDWVVRIPQSSYQVIPNDGVTEYRGAYTRANDYLQWAIEYVYDHIDTTLAAKLLDEISLVRNGMNTNNFDVLTYNTMVDLAKVVESQYSIDITYNVDEAVIDDEGNTTMGPDGKPVTQTVTKTDTIYFGDYNGYMENENIEVTSVAVTSNLSSVQIDEYIRLFNIYMSKVVERGYQGNQIEAEIECASGNTYNNLVATKATYDEESGELLTPAVVTKGASAVEPKFGAWSEDGTLVNEGETVYSAETWNAYVEALANAVAVAQLGNGSYAHKDVANYNPTAGDYDAQISDCYYTDTALQAAEIALEEDVEEPANEITVSGTVMVATDLTGTTYTSGIVGIDVYAGDQLVATSAEDGSFTATVPVGTTELTFKGSTTIDRTVTLSGTADVTGAIVPIVICDYNKDSYMNTIDNTVFSTALNQEYNVYCDFNCDGSINTLDYTTFSVFLGKTVTYAPLALD